MPDRATELACGVLSIRDEPGVLDAVRSLVTQSEPVEVVVVNSGGGDPRPRLRAAGLDVPVVNHRERLLPGAARNAAIDATRSRYVAFLAADCVAEPGWAAERVRAHQAGAAAVASAVVSGSAPTASAVASHFLLHHRRAPTAEPRRHELYGLSYDRRLFERFGRFRDDLRTGEDTEFNQRLPPAVRVVWVPGVRTAVRYPTAFPAFVRDQFERGRLIERSNAAIGGRPRTIALASRALRNLRPAVRQALRRPPSGGRLTAPSALLLLPTGALARVAGIVVERLTPRTRGRWGADAARGRARR